MSFSQNVTEALTNAAAKALATDGPHGINVVPVSMIKVNDGSIWLFDFFMGKTIANIEANQQVSLTAWSDMIGLQVKADVSYVTEGDAFDTAVAWAKTQNPTRVTKGLLILTPTAMFDISPGGTFTENDLSI